MILGLLAACGTGDPPDRVVRAVKLLAAELPGDQLDGVLTRVVLEARAGAVTLDEVEQLETLLLDVFADGIVEAPERELVATFGGHDWTGTPDADLRRELDGIRHWEARRCDAMAEWADLGRFVPADRHAPRAGQGASVPWCQPW